MSSAFATAVAAPKTLAPDPSKRVNYTLGMLLGVDDFNQEFAYLSGRDQWLARDLLGYGTLNGLRVSLDTPEKGPRVNVTSGSALSPCGQLICVKPAQCAYLNDWLAANQAAVTQLVTSPPGNPLRLYLVLCYRSCPVDAVPIPGEPCRTDSDLTAPSRLQDDFHLELRTTAARQPDEDAVREFAQWLDQIQLTDDAGSFISPQDFEKTIRSAIPAAADVAAHGLHLPLGSPLANVRIHPADAREFLRIALRLWATDIRPLVHPPCPPATGCCCGDAPADKLPPTDDCLLLAELDVPLINVGPGVNWRVSDATPVTLDESRRPYLAHLRLVQELVEGLAAKSGAAEMGVAAGPVPAEIVAAGIVSAAAARTPVLGGLAVTAPQAGRLVVNFGGYRLPANAFQFLVKATPLAAAPAPTVSVDSFANNGILLNVARGAILVPQVELNSMQFMIEITRIG